MLAFLIFLIEAGAALILVATGYHWSWHLSAGWALALPPIAAVILFLFLFNRDFYFDDVPGEEESTVGMALAAMMVSGVLGCFAAPALLVATGALAASSIVLASSVGMIVLIFVFAILGAEFEDWKRRRYRETS